MTNPNEVETGLSQCHPGPLEPVDAIPTQAPDIRVEVEPDPRGVSVGVWQGSHCIYSGAHPLPAAPGVSTVEDAQAEQPYCYALETRGHHGDQQDVLLDVEYNGTDSFSGGRTGGIPLYRRPAPAAGDALDAARWRAYARLFPEISASFLATHGVDGGDPLPTIKGASITGGYVVVTPAGWDADKATKLRDAILRLFPVNPVHTPRPSDELAAQRKGGA